MRALLAIAVLLSVTSFSVGVPSARAETACRFVLGFKVLHDGLLETVGDCLENEKYDENGALQHTTKGLMAWRKSDNFTAFTDGYRTWVNGLYGIQMRLNTDRFAWEHDPPARAAPVLGNAALPISPGAFRPASELACALKKEDVGFPGFEKGFDGAVWAEGAVRNSCPSSISATIDVYARERAGGPVTMVANTIVVDSLEPGQSRSITLRIPAASAATVFDWQVTTVGYDRWCMEGQPAACVDVDPWLASSFAALTDLDEGRRLAYAALGAGVRIIRGTNDYGVLAAFVPSRNLIIVDRMLDRQSAWARATVLAHELQHVIDFAGRKQWSSAECYQGEETARRREASVWRQLWGDRLPPDVDVLFEELNEVAKMTSQQPVGSEVLRQYSPLCK